VWVFIGGDSMKQKANLDVFEAVMSREDRRLVYFARFGFSGNALPKSIASDAKNVVRLNR